MGDKTVEFEQQDSDHIYMKALQIDLSKINKDYLKLKKDIIRSYVPYMLYWHSVTLIDNTYICDKKKK